MLVMGAEAQELSLAAMAAAFAQSGPVGPPALLGWKVWIAGLGDSGLEDIVNTGINTPAFQALKLFEEFNVVLVDQLPDFGDTEIFEDLHKRWTDGHQVY